MGMISLLSLETFLASVVVAVGFKNKVYTLIITLAKKKDSRTQYLDR